MKIAKPMKITSTAKKDAKVKDKSYLMVEASDGRYYPMDPTWDFTDGAPDSIAKSGVEEVDPKAFKDARKAEK